MVATITPELQKFYEEYWSYEMYLDLAEKIHNKERQEHYEVVKHKEWDSVCAYVQRMQIYVEQLEDLNVSFHKEFSIDMVLNSLTPSYDQFISTIIWTTGDDIDPTPQLIENYWIRDEEKFYPFYDKCFCPGHWSNQRKKKKSSSQSNWKGKTHFGASASRSKANPNFDVPCVTDLKEVTCFHYSEKGH